MRGPILTNIGFFAAGSLRRLARVSSFVDLALRAIGYPAEPHIAALLKPDGQRQGRYQELYQIYRGLYPILADSMHELGRLAAQ